nr:E4.1 [Tern adenovirus]
MANDVRYDTFSQELLQIFRDIDHVKFSCFAFVTATEPLDFYAVGPFRIVFQLSNDRTVYGIAQNDLYPEFNMTDFIRWLFIDDQVCTCFTPIKWIDIEQALDSSTNEHCSYYLIPSETDNESWEAFKLFTGWFYPLYLSYRVGWQ